MLCAQPAPSTTGKWRHRHSAQWTCLDPKHAYARTGWRNDIDRETCAWKCRTTGLLCGAPRPDSLAAPAPKPDKKKSKGLAFSQIFPHPSAWTCVSCGTAGEATTHCVLCLRSRFEVDVAVQEGVMMVCTSLDTLPMDSNKEGCARFLLNTFQFDVPSTMILAGLMEQLPGRSGHELVAWVRATVQDIAKTLHISVEKATPLLVRAASEALDTRAPWTPQTVYDRSLALHEDEHGDAELEKLVGILLGDEACEFSGSKWQDSCDLVAATHEMVSARFLCDGSIEADADSTICIECVCCLNEMSLTAAGKNSDRCMLSCGCSNVCAYCAETIVLHGMACPNWCGVEVMGHFPFP